MEMDLKKVEKIRIKANVTYEEARQALEASGGDLLEAIIQLERQGKIKEPAGGGYYSSRENNPNESASQNDGYSNKRRNKDYAQQDRQQFRSFLRWCGRVIHKGNTNYFDITKIEEPGNTVKPVTSVPLTVLALLLFFAFWIIVPLLVVLLFFGYRYSFRGPEFNYVNLNHAMDKAADTVNHIKDEVKEGMGEKTENRG